MRKTIYLTIIISLFILPASAANLTVEMQDKQGDRINSDIELREDGSAVAGPSASIDTTVNDGENYTLIQETTQGPNVTMYNFSITQDLDLRPTVYENENPKENFLANTDSLYFISSDFNFSKAEFEAERNQPDSIAKCNSISNNECTSWTVNTTSQYESSYTNSIFRYNVTTFSGYTAGEEAPLPEIQNIEIYNVSKVQDRRNNGVLIDSGLNSTFQVEQKNATEYRLEFNVTNNGSDTWVLTTDDKLLHSGLNQSWDVNESDDIYYRINDSIKEGGTFNSGKVSWNTGNGGELGVGDNLSAEYIINISQGSTNTFDQYFNASTTSDTSDQDFHELRTLILGAIEPLIDKPENESIIQNNREFTLNGTVNCLEGDCGEVTANPRQNESSGQQLISGNEFEVLDSNNNCANLLEDESCTVNWSINASVDPNTFHELDFSASSNYSEIDEEDSADSIVEVQDILMIDLDWNVTEFGVLDPGEKDNPAERNNEGYNLTVEEESNTVDNLWIKASSLISRRNDNYQIDPTFMSWSDTPSITDSRYNFSETYQSLNYSQLSPGTTKTLYYWLNVPYGITIGEYTGTMTFKANQSQ